MSTDKRTEATRLLATHLATDQDNIALSGWLTRANLEAFPTLWLLYPLIDGFYQKAETLRDDNGSNAGINSNPNWKANGYNPAFFRPAPATTKPEPQLNQSATPKYAG